ncbi:hypothetical protein [Congzhengia minquanensis]|uniref:Uncharacterized protein n=1 Tax=Congzhengia minquanensis TaxID=2763657 RepID=A0A926DL07_9FIRM|nr:hypothetical protein [Congzhengia minquanensis]MBC8539983.1 hypothetical protein [Congzhengia minquanensis]
MDNEKLLESIGVMLDRQSNELKADMKDLESRMKVVIENDVTTRINALVDGYKLVHEKQWELEQKLSQLERRLEKLEIAG